MPKFPFLCDVNLNQSSLEAVNNLVATNMAHMAHMAHVTHTSHGLPAFSL
jgi:hypothetical protein